MPIFVSLTAAATRLARALSNGWRRSSVLATGSSIASAGTSDSDGCSAAESWMLSVPISRANASHSSMALSGSLSLTSRGVSSWSAAVRMPILMNLGWNGLTDIFVAPLYSDRFCEPEDHALWVHARENLIVWLVGGVLVHEHVQAFTTPGDDGHFGRSRVFDQLDRPMVLTAFQHDVFGANAEQHAFRAVVAGRYRRQRQALLGGVHPIARRHGNDVDTGLPHLSGHG